MSTFIKGVLTATILLGTCFGAPVNITGIPCVGGANGCEGNGFFTGTLNYTDTDATHAQLVLSLTNSLSSAAGGFITNVAFNNPSNDITGVTYGTTLATFDTLMGGPTFDNSIDAAPLGSFDIGAGTSGVFNGGGSPNGGIARGNSATLTFTLTGTGLDTLTTQSFVNTLDTSGTGFLYVRFRGFDNGGSDKVLASVVPTPEPRLLSLLLVLAAGVGYFARKRSVASV